MPYLNMARERGKKYTHLKTHAGAINSRLNFRKTSLSQENGGGITSGQKLDLEKSSRRSPRSDSPPRTRPTT